MSRKAPRIVALVPARNEGPRIGLCLQALARFVDAIVFLDDCSEDDTVRVVESLAGKCRVERILRKTSWHRNEPEDRNALLKAGREIGGTHFVVMDADEAFTANCQRHDFLRQMVLALQPGDRLAMTWIQLWRSLAQYRFDDSVWTWNTKEFAFGDNGKCGYASQFIHTSRAPKNLKGRVHALPGYRHGVLHFQFINWANLLIKQAWYHCLERIRDPQKAPKLINELYAPAKDESGLRLRPVPAEWVAGYEFLSSSAFAMPDQWRVRQILGWFSEYGRDHFADLNIWDVPWDTLEQSWKPSPPAAPIIETSSPAHGAQAPVWRAPLRALREQGQRDELKKFGLQILRQMPDDLELLLALGQAYAELGDSEAARWEFAKEAALQPNSGATLARRAEQALQAGRRAEFNVRFGQILNSRNVAREDLKTLARLCLAKMRPLQAGRLYGRMASPQT